MRGDYVRGGRGVMSVYRMGEREGRERGGGGKADVNHGEGRGNSCREVGGRGIAPPELNLTDCMNATY